MRNLVGVIYRRGLLQTPILQHRHNDTHHHHAQPPHLLPPHFTRSPVIRVPTPTLHLPRARTHQASLRLTPLLNRNKPGHRLTNIPIIPSELARILSITRLIAAELDAEESVVGIRGWRLLCAGDAGVGAGGVESVEGAGCGHHCGNISIVRAVKIMD